MLSTELISLPTGFIFLCAMGTLWRGRIRFTVPMLFCLAWAFNFLWGGISGVFHSDVPSDVTTHGSFFSMAHFHYTIMGGLVFTFFAAIYYWVPKMTGFKFNERLAKIHFWTMFLAFNSTFAPLFALGFLGMPRRVVTYPSEPAGAQRLGLGVGVRARALDAGVPVQRGLVAGHQARALRAEPVALEVGRMAAADAGARARLRAHPGVRCRPLSRTASSPSRRGSGRRQRPERCSAHGSLSPSRRTRRARAARVAAARSVGIGARCSCGAISFFFVVLPVRVLLSAVA